MHPWHTLSTGQVLEQLRADPVSGLAVNEAAQRLQHYGLAGCGHHPGHRPGQRRHLPLPRVQRPTCPGRPPADERSPGTGHP